MKLKGKVALVTGGSRGIGEAIVYALADEGASIGVNYIQNREMAEQICKNVQKNGGKAIPIQGDISVPVDVDAMFDKTISEFGKVDILINNAGIDQELVPTIEQPIDQCLHYLLEYPLYQIH